MGLRSVPPTFAHYDDVYVPADRRVGKDGQGLQIAFSALDSGRWHRRSRRWLGPDGLLCPGASGFRQEDHRPSGTPAPRVISKAARPPRRAAPVKTALLSVRSAAGVPTRVNAVVKVATTSGPLKVRRATLAITSREWSSMRLRISHRRRPRGASG
jgi:hypothetical protein